MALAQLLELVRSTGRLNPVQWDAWEQWCDLLPEECRQELLDLQALLGCVVAFGYFENHRPGEHVANFKPQLFVLREAMRTALGLARSLRRRGDSQQRLRAVRETTPNDETPEGAIAALEASLSDAFRVLDPFCQSDSVGIESFHACCDLIHRDLDRNPFFSPLGPLEFSSVELGPMVDAGLLRTNALVTGTGSTATTLALVGLHRLFRYSALGRRLPPGQAHVVFAGVRSNVRALSRFMSTQGTTASDKASGSTMQSLGILLREDTEEALALAPPLDSDRSVPSLVLDSVDGAVREVISQLGQLVRRITATSEGEGAPSHELGRLRLYTWMLHYVMRGFITKASLAAECTASQDLSFVADFMEHLRSLGRPALEELPYDRRPDLVARLKALKNARTIDAELLRAAATECSMFAQHLEEALRVFNRREDLPPFDTVAAARRFRRYLAKVQAERGSPSVATAPGRVPHLRAQESRTRPRTQ